MSEIFANIFRAPVPLPSELEKTRLPAQESLFGAWLVQLTLRPKPRPEGLGSAPTWVKMIVLVEKCNQVSVIRTRVLLEVNYLRAALVQRKPT